MRKEQFRTTPPRFPTAIVQIGRINPNLPLDEYQRLHFGDDIGILFDAVVLGTNPATIDYDSVNKSPRMMAMDEDEQDEIMEMVEEQVRKIHPIRDARLTMPAAYYREQIIQEMIWR